MSTSSDAASAASAPEKRPTKAAEEIAAVLRRKIVLGELEEGESLGSEASQLKVHSVSRPILREAISILESESLVRVERGARGGIRVGRPSIGVVARYAALLLQLRRTTIRDVCEARGNILPPAVGILAASDPKSSSRQLLTCLDREKEVLDDPRAFARASTQFLDKLVELTGNRTLTLLCQILQDIVVAAVENASLSGPREETRAAMERAYRGHRKLVTLIGSGKARDAEEYLREHLRVSTKVLLAELGGQAIVDVSGRDNLLRAPKRAELVAHHLRRKIAHRELEEGDKLGPVSELQRDFAISRPTLVEALRILEAEQLIEIRQGVYGGAIVKTPHIRTAARYAGLFLVHAGTTFADLYWARTVIEPPAARRIAERSDKSTAINALRATIDEARDARHDPLRIARVTTGFHLSLVELAGNQTLALLTELLAEFIEGHVEKVFEAEAQKGNYDQAIERGRQSLETLVTLIEHGMAEEAESFWRAHLDRLTTTMLESVGSETTISFRD